MSTIPRNEGFTQVYVWPGTIVTAEKVDQFVAWMQDEFGVRVQYLEEIQTGPDFDNPLTGGRNDVIFAVHKGDIAKFAVPRLSVGIRWVEDVLDNEYRHNMNASPARPFHSIYPAHIKEYRTW